MIAARSSDMDEQRLFSVLGDLYDAATDPARLSRIGASVQRAMEVESCIVFAARQGTGELLQLVSASANFDEKARADYRAYYHARNQWYQNAAASRQPPYVGRGEEIIDYREFEKTEFCADWCPRVGIYRMIGGFTPVRDGVFAACGVHAPRGAGPFDDGKKRLFTAIMQHMGRVFQIAERLGVLFHGQAVTLGLIEGLHVGVIILDASCRPVLVNAVAQRMLKVSRWFAAPGGRIRPVHPASVTEFERQVALAAAASAGGCAASGAILSLRDPLDSDLAVLIAPFRSIELCFGATQPVAAVIFLDPDAAARPAARDIAKVYGLTQAEGRLVATLVRGRNLVAAAKEGGISVNTAKTQLRSVFLRTGYERQTDLIAAVLSHPVLRLAARSGL
jgi:DNA-binding CsgD family transcriptional regulator